jgi:hypothetical protein
MKNILFIAFVLLFATKTTAQTIEDYGTIFLSTTEIGFKLTMAQKDALQLSKNLKKEKNLLDFREEYTLKVNEKGLKEVTFYFDKDGEKPLYELIYEFENADSVEILMNAAFGAANHPRLAEHWVISINDQNVAFMIWRFENKIIMAANLPETELADEYSFQFDQAFIDAMRQADTQEPAASEPDSTVYMPDAPADQQLTQIINSYIENALLDFEGIKGNPVEGKKDEYLSLLPYYMDDTNGTVIRKNTNNVWRLEAKLAVKESLANAQTVFDNMKSQLVSLEALEYQLIRKSDYATNTAKTFIWSVQNLDGDPLGIIMKLQLYAAGGGLYSVRLEIGK